MQKIEKDHVLEVRRYLLTVQENIISMVNNYDKQNFLKDEWSRKEGGGGISCILENLNFLYSGEKNEKITSNLNGIF